MGIDLSEFTRREPFRCVVAKRIIDLSAEDMEKFVAALGEETIPTTGIQRWLASRSIHINRDSIRTHRFGTCACRD